jgi:ATP-dependent DNA helicase Rep
MEEERRLAYVGMTRAGRTLTLTHAVGRTRWSKDMVCTPSRFLDELPEEGIEREDRRDGEEEVDLIEEDRIAEEYIKRIRARF